MRSPLHDVRSELTLRRLSAREAWALGVIMLGALALYVALQHGRVFIGDEIGTLRYIKKSPGYILTHFATHLTMNYFILAEKGVAWLSSAHDWRLTLLPLIGAVATIPLTASLALKLTGSTRTALISAAVAAFNPYLVMWAPMIRSYSLLIACSLWAINEFFNWHWRRDWAHGMRCAGVVLLLLLVHLNGAYTVAFLVLLLLIEALYAGWSGGREFVWQSRTLWMPLALAAAGVGAAYWHLLPDIARVNREWGTDTPPTSMAYIPEVFSTYMGVGHAALLSGLLLIAGCWSALREKRALLLLCGGIILSPILLSLQGVSVQSWAFARYLIYCLPWILILLAGGVDWVARRAPAGAGQAAIAWCLTLLVLLSWTPNLSAQFAAKKQLPYSEVAEFLHAQLRENDVIVAGWSLGFTLSQFFEDASSRIMLPGDYVSRIARRLDYGAGRVFYVTGLGRSHDRIAPVRRFGRLEVTTYEGRTPRMLLQEWREDLIRRTRERVIAAFQGDYELLAMIEELIPSGKSASHWRSLAKRCRSLSPVDRGTPRHMLKATRAVKFP